MDSGFNLGWLTGMTSGKLFILGLGFLTLNGQCCWVDNHQVCEDAQHGAHTQSLGTPPSPRKWLERSHTSHRVTMRHIQLYFIIRKKLYSDRVTRSVSQQKANATSEKPLPKVRTVQPFSM